MPSIRGIMPSIGAKVGFDSIQISNFSFHFRNVTTRFSTYIGLFRSISFWLIGVRTGFSAVM